MADPWDVSEPEALPPPDRSPGGGPLARLPMVPSVGTSLRLAFLLTILAVLAASSPALRNASSAARFVETSGEALDAHKGLLALRLAYPDKITDLRLDFETGEWVIEAGGKVFCWADGRVLPLEERDKAASYRPFIAYLYPWDLIDPASLDDETVERLKRMPDELKNAPPTHPAFYTVLYGGRTEKALWARQRKTRFLGKALNVHEMIVSPLKEVETDILAAAERSERVKNFLKEIHYAGAYNFRRIRGQQELSRHSYGVAVDILPKGRAARKTYWLWILEEDPEWPRYPLAKRWMPPDEVVRIFEEHGFVWGGKWLDYDTMHFEYRPEMLRLREMYLPPHLIHARMD